MAQLRRLFQPGRIGTLELKNRLVMAPMATWSHDIDGFVLPRTLGYYEARARGGVALIICQSAVVLPEARAPGRLAVWDDKFMPGLASMSAAIHAGGAKCALQITHHGTILSQHKKSVKGPPEIDVVGASPVPWVFNNEAPREASQQDIDHLVNGLSEAARRVRDAGFDAVEIGGAHGYLVAQFLSPRTNCRTDGYGGSPEKRARFACEVVAAVKAKAGRNFPVIFRMSADEFIAGGITLEEARVHARLVAEAGADALHVSAGTVDTGHYTNPCYLYPDALFADLAAEIKKTVKVPVVAVGKILEPSLAESLLETGKADFVAMGRALLADPDLPRKAEQGDAEDINRCIYCNNCWDLQWRESFKQRGLSCTVNPAVLREPDFDPKQAPVPKRVMVIGGGIAGIEAARTLAARGHHVSLYEKSPFLGGQWQIAALLPMKQAYGAMLQQKITQMRQAGVSVALNQEANVDLVRMATPDAVVVATGAVPRWLNLPGAKGTNVVQAVDVISGKARTGKTVVVVGGRYLGMETALLLAEQGKQVSLVTERELGRNGRFVERHMRLALRDRLVEHGVFVYPFSPLNQVSSDGVYLVNTRDIMFLKADTVVMAVGAVAQNKLAQELKAAFPQMEIRAIGDCVEPRDAMEAIREGAEVGRLI